MGIIQRILGISATKLPRNPGAWKLKKEKVVIDWARAPELHQPCGAIRLEGHGLPARILLLYGMDGQFHAFKNKCLHTGRRLDPVEKTSTIQSCSLFKSTFDYAGKVVLGPARRSIEVLRVENRKCKVIIRLD